MPNGTVDFMDRICPFAQSLPNNPEPMCFGRRDSYFHSIHIAPSQLQVLKYLLDLVALVVSMYYSIHDISRVAGVGAGGRR
jgi:hypothetical protein